MTVSRRAVLKAGVSTLATGVVGSGSVHSRWGRGRAITIAGGQDKGFYLEFARLLVREITAAEPDLRCGALETDGSVRNIQLVVDGHADIGVSQADVALAAFHGKDPFQSAVPIRGIGRVYQDYLQLVVRKNGPIRTVADLADKPVSLGARGSGTAVFSQRLIEASGLRVDARFQPLLEATSALATGEISALSWSGGVPTPALTELHERVGIRLLPTEHLLRALRARHGVVYRQVTIPPGGYGQGGTRCVGVANLLVCASTLPDSIVTAVTRVLVERAAQLVPREALGIQFLDSRTLIGMFGVPMHPGAAIAYRQHHG